MKQGGLEGPHQGLGPTSLGREEARARSWWVALLERELSAAVVVQKMRSDPCPLSVVTGILGVQAGVWAVLKTP